MNVSLIDYTQDAEDILIFTKRTRLEMTPATLDAVRAMPSEKKLEELRYMSRTIPSSWEFVGYTFLIEGVSRAFTHQFVRTRTASFAQQSMRVTPMTGYEFVMPERYEKNAMLHTIAYNANNDIERAHRLLLENGSAPEDARSILPTNIATNIVARFNMRTLVETAQSRLGGRTQSEYRDVMNLMVDSVLAVHPWMNFFFFANEERDYFDEIEVFAEEEFGGDLVRKGKLLKIVDAMRKEK